MSLFLTQDPESELIMQSPAQRVHLLMVEQNINQKELAKRISRAPSLVSSYLSTEAELNEMFVLRMQDRLGWSALWIRTGQGPKYVTNIFQQKGLDQPNQNSQGANLNISGNPVDADKLRLESENRMLRDQLAREREFTNTLRDLLQGGTNNKI